MSTRLDEIVAQLLGSQSSFESALTADELKNPLLRQELFDQVQTWHARPCNDCDYWFELEELNMHQQCADCVRTQQ